MLRSFLTFCLIVIFLFESLSYANTVSPTPPICKNMQHRQRQAWKQYSVPKDTTKDFISYLDTLVQKGVLKEPQLERLLESLTEPKIKNPLSLTEAASSSEGTLHYYGIEKFLQHPHFDRQKVSEWILIKLKRKKVETVERKKAFIKTLNLYQKISMVMIEKGHYFYTYAQKEIKEVIERPFAFQTTEVTQLQYAMVMGVNPSGFVEGAKTQFVEGQGHKVRVQPDHPVDTVGWKDGVAFANRINELVMEDSPLIPYLLPEHKKGMVYRLPTEAEWEYVARLLGNQKEVFSFGGDWAKITEYAWMGENANKRTHAVAQLKPVVVNGKPIFDLHGNVAEWVLSHKDGKSDWVQKGGSWSDLAWTCQTANSSPDHGGGYRSDVTGIRLVAELNP